MHKEWESLKLGDVLEKIEGGGTPSKDKSEYWNGSIPWASVKDIVTHNPIDTVDHITEEGLSNSSSKLIPAGILITPTRMALGCVVLFDVPVAINQDLKALYPNKNLNKKFLYYWFQKNSATIEKMGNGSTVTGIQLSELKGLPINLPSSEEQEQIVKALEMWDSYLATTNNKINFKRNIKKALTQQLLVGKKRLAGFSSAWDTVRLGDIATIKRGGSPRPIDSYFTDADTGLNWLKIGDIKPGSRYITRTAQKIKPEGLNKTTMVHEGDFILSNSMSFGRPYIMKISACIHDGWLALMDIKPNVNKSFLFYMLSSSKIQGKFKALSAGSGVQNLKKETVATVEIQLPSVEEQIAIANILHDADDEIELLVEERRLIAAQRDYLIHNLVSGKLRLPAEKADSKETTYA